MPRLGRFFVFKSGFASEIENKTFSVSRRQFSCWRYLCFFYGIETSFSCILSCVCTSQNVEFCLIPHDNGIYSFTHSRTSLVLPDTAIFTFAESAKSANATRRSHYHPAAFIRVSKFQVNLGCPNRQRKCFPTADIFRCN